MTVNSTESKNNWVLKSPNGKISIRIRCVEDGRVIYSVVREEETIIQDSPLGLNTSIADFTSGLTYLGSSSRVINETYSLTSGKKTLCTNHCNEIKLKFRKRSRIIYLQFRAYNDGIAYRYLLPYDSQVSIYSESSAFVLPEGLSGWAQNLVCNYEEFYTYREFDAIGESRLGMPVLVKYPGGNWALISEAAVYENYCGCHIQTSSKDKNVLKVVFAQDQINPVVSMGPLETPWRVVIIGPDLAAIVESSIIENLNPDSEVGDTSWIKPGRSAWSWWSGDSTTDYDVQVKYVDFAAAMGWEYYLCDAGWKEEWIEKLVNYARSKNVDIWVWSHHMHLMTDDDIFDKLPRWAAIGVKGIKVDFFDSDSQDKIRIYDKLARAAAQYKLMVNYHGATKPSGERRRWPHLMTRDGILGAEYYKWSDGPTAQHNCTVPFTRNAVGPMDYTPVVFSNNKGQTTWAHQLALAVVFESGIQHMADCPEAYENLGDALRFLKLCPASWDDTKLLQGYPGEYATIARRKCKDWFIGAICAGNDGRKTALPLCFLESNTKYRMEIHKDGAHREEILVQQNVVENSTILEIDLAPNGGCTVYLSPIE